MCKALPMNAVEEWSPRNEINEAAREVREEQDGDSDMVFLDPELIAALTRAQVPYPEARRAVVRELCGHEGLPDIPL
jgi:hypothetical protein